MLGSNPSACQVSKKGAEWGQERSCPHSVLVTLLPLGEPKRYYAKLHIISLIESFTLSKVECNYPEKIRKIASSTLDNLIHCNDFKNSSITDFSRSS